MPIIWKKWLGAENEEKEQIGDDFSVCMLKLHLAVGILSRLVVISPMKAEI